MIVVGISLPSTIDGMRLNDGGCALIKDKEIYAIAEERISRVKHDGGYEKSLKYCLAAANVMLEEVDLFVVSSCCEKARTIENVSIEGVPKNKIIICPSHHLAHALSTYCVSGMEEALIMVIDNEGNILDNDTDDDMPFHKRKMEHMSYYLGNQNGVTLVETDDVEHDKIGIGDAYRYFTHYLGFPSYVYAGKTMGLAAYGDKNCYIEKKIFSIKDGRILCDIENEYNDCISSVEKFLKNQNIECKHRTPIDEIQKEHANLARWIQRELEDVLVEKVKYLVKKTNIKKLCIAGGIGLNSVANAEILKRSGITDVFIIPAAGDTGQCLGNALYGLWKITNRVPQIPINDCYFGIMYSESQITNAIKILEDDDNYEIYYFNSMEEQVALEAELLWGNKYVGHFDGRSEFGPRALGNRSILANPCSVNAKDELNCKIKYRENFRPFAPITLNTNANFYFDCDRELPFMLVVTSVKVDTIPAVTHIDGTARLQTVNDCQNHRICELLREFEKLSGMPILLNTSFNIAGEPIVETPEDAIECFRLTALDAISIGNYIVVKKNVDVKMDDYTKFITSLGSNL